MQEAQMKTILIDSNDRDFLQKLARSMNHQVRLLWTPAPTRLKPVVEVTSVSVVAEEGCFVDYTLYELNKDRKRRGKLVESAETVVNVGSKAPTGPQCY